MPLRGSENDIYLVMYCMHRVGRRAEGQRIRVGRRAEGQRIRVGRRAEGQRIFA